MTARSRSRTALAALADARVGLGVAAVIACAAVCIDVLQDPDMWWHLRTGQFILATHSIPQAEMYSYTAAGHHQTLGSWLAEVIYALLNHAGGLLTIAIFMAVIGASGFVALAIRGRFRGASWIALAFALILMAKTAAPVMGTRTQVWSFALTCWALYVVERSLRDGGRWPWLLPPMFLAWANLHAGFAVGWGVLALLVTIEVISNRRERDVPRVNNIKRLVAALAAAAIAACITPFGPSIWTFALGGGSGELSKPISEWQSPNFHDPAMLPLLVAICILISLRFVGRRTTLRDGVLDTIAVAAALIAVRNTQVLVAVATPSIALLSDEAWERWGPSHWRGVASKAPLLSAVAIAGACLAVGVRVTAAAHDASPSGVAAAYPACVAQQLSTAPTDTRLFAPYGQDGYFIDQAWPRAHVYVYGESISLGANVFANYGTISGGGLTTPSALDLLDSSRTNAVLTSPGNLSLDLSQSAEWKATAVHDLGMQLWVRDTTTWADELHPC